MRRLLLLFAAAFAFVHSTAFCQQPGTKLWEFQASLGGGAAPTLGPDGKVYFLSLGDSNLYALNPNGTEAWRYLLPGNPAGSPVIGPNGTVYAFASRWSLGPNWGGTLLAITNGSLKWKFEAGRPTLGSPALGADGTIYIGTVGQASTGASTSFVYAVSGEGELKWSFAISSFSEMPDIYHISLGTDGALYFGAGYKTYAVSRTGQRKWAFPGGKQWSPAAIGKDGTVYIAPSGRLFALHAESTNPNGTKAWEFAGVGVGEGGFPPTIAADGTIYVGSDNLALYAIRPNGTKKWEFQTGGSLYYCSTAIASDGTIYMGSHDRFLYAINSNGTFRWAFETGGAVYPRSTPQWSAQMGQSMSVRLITSSTRSKEQDSRR